jgi:hypothetical protein
VESPTIVIQEISEDKKTLIFYENSFTVGEEEAEVTIARVMSDLEYVCENENRLWGVGGNTIYSSKLGDPFNWNVQPSFDRQLCGRRGKRGGLDRGYFLSWLSLLFLRKPDLQNVWF